MKLRMFFISAILASATLSVVFFFNTGTDTGDKNSSEDSSGLFVRNNAIYVSEQKPGETVSVSLVRLDMPGFVVVHEDNAGNPGKILGSSAVIPAGESKNPPSIQLSRELKNGETIYAMLHFDNGDGKFNSSDDKPILDKAAGEPMMMVVDVSKDAPEPGIINL